jgi:hypothetical protein
VRALALPLALSALSLAACANTVDHSGGSLDAGDDAGFQLDTSGEGGLDPDAACGAVRVQAQTFPLNLYVMLDKSASMDGPKWNAAKTGLAAFVNDARSSGIRVALNFFPRVIDPAGAPGCDANAYATPRVPFVMLTADAKKITDAIGLETPDGFNTPTWPALGGAILGTQAEMKTRPPTERGAVLLVTDGDPVGPASMCSGIDPTKSSEIAKIAQAGLNASPSIPTFVIGLPGVTQSIVDPIAAAGGSGSAVVITDTVNTQQAFQDALAKVRGKAVPCEYQLPPKVVSGEIGVGFVNVEYTPGTGAAQSLPQSPSCSALGWRYDDPAKPTKIILCPKACDAVQNDSKAQVDVLLGCATVIR